MKVIYLSDEIKYLNNLTLTIGNFDGLHLGHIKLVDEVLKYEDTKSAAMTFNPHPNFYFKGDSEAITTLDEKISLFEKTKLDYLIIVDFNYIVNLSPSDFINYLKTLGVKRIIVGKDFRFGKKAMGSVNDLVSEFETVIYEEVLINSIRISSTLIKSLIKEGNIEKANYYLGYNYFINGYVEDGNKVGRTLGFPTANINYGASLLPKNGVYLTKIIVNDKAYYSITNIGNNPTVNYSKERKLESYILDYNEYIYQLNVKLEFILHLRDEIKFASVEELKNQMNNDEIFVRNYLKNNNLW